MRILKSLLREKKRLINFYVSPEEKALMQSKADEYTSGNLSEWVRYAAVHYQPRRAPRIHKPSELRILMNVNATFAEKARIEQNVSEHLDWIGNLSDWVRCSAIYHVPSREDLIAL